MVLVLVARSVALWLLAAELLSGFVLFIVVLLCLVDPVQHCDHSVWEKGSGLLCFSLLFVGYVLSVMVCLLFLLVSLVGYSPVSILYKSIAGRYRPVRVPDGPITARYRFIKNASWDFCNCSYSSRASK